MHQDTQPTVNTVTMNWHFNLEGILYAAMAILEWGIMSLFIEGNINLVTLVDCKWVCHWTKPLERMNNPQVQKCDTLAYQTESEINPCIYTLCFIYINYTAILDD